MNPIKHDSHTIPAKCRFVYYALCGRLGQTEYTKVYRAWRYIDLIRVTGRNSSDRKLRELIESCPGLVSSETVSGDNGPYKRFWLADARALSSVQIQPVTTSSSGALFDLQPLGRPE